MTDSATDSAKVSDPIAPLQAAIGPPQLTLYQVAVLSTLFEEADCGKVGDLARQWGCCQTFLSEAWSQMHDQASDRRSRG